MYYYNIVNYIEFELINIKKAAAHLIYADATTAVIL